MVLSGGTELSEEAKESAPQNEGEPDTLMGQAVESCSPDLDEFRSEQRTYTQGKNIRL